MALCSSSHHLTPRSADAFLVRADTIKSLAISHTCWIIFYAYLCVRSVLFAFLNFAVPYPSSSRFFRHDPYPFPFYYACKAGAAVTLLQAVVAVLSLFWTTNIFSCERSYKKIRFFTSTKVFALLYAKQRYYMLNKNIVLHNIPGYMVPISAIWVALKININVQ